jgi:hypothetical protein
MTLDDLVAYVNSLHDYQHRVQTTFTEPTEFRHHNYTQLKSFMEEVTVILAL